jgi:predicted TIM-barrel fold metal-dependent hydrolase
MFSNKCFCNMLRSFGRLLKAWPAYVLVAGLFYGQAQAADAVLGAVAAKSIPIVDAHLHVMTWMDVRELVGYMDRNGIRWAGGVGIGGGKSPGAGQSKFAETVSVLGSRYIRPTGQGAWLMLHQTLNAAAFENPDTPAVKERLSAIEGDLHDRGARVIGEIHVNARTTSPETITQFKVRADSPTLKALFDLAGKYNRPLNIHTQWDSDTAQEVERLAASNRRARLVLSHCGCFATPSDIRGVFERNANVSCDLSYRGAPPIRGRSAYQAVFDERSILGGWKKLIEDYPDRFVVGVDIPHSWEDYESIVHAIRFGLLANLSPETAEKVAHKNAQAWFGLE